MKKKKSTNIAIIALLLFLATMACAQTNDSLLLVHQKNKWNGNLQVGLSYTGGDPVFNTIYITTTHGRTQFPLWKALVLDVGGYGAVYSTNSKYSTDFFEYFNPRTTAQLEKHMAAALLLKYNYSNKLKGKKHKSKTYIGGVALSSFSLKDVGSYETTENAKYSAFSKKYFGENGSVERSASYYDVYLYLQYSHYFGSKSIMFELNLITPYDFFKQQEVYKKGVRIKTKYSIQPVTFLLDVYAPIRENSYATLVLNPKMFGVKAEASFVWKPKELRKVHNGCHITFAGGFKQFYHTANMYYENPFSGLDGIANVWYFKVALTGLEF